MIIWCDSYLNRWISLWESFFIIVPRSITIHKMKFFKTIILAVISGSNADAVDDLDFLLWVLIIMLKYYYELKFKASFESGGFYTDLILDRCILISSTEKPLPSELKIRALEDSLTGRLNVIFMHWKIKKRWKTHSVDAVQKLIHILRF